MTPTEFYDQLKRHDWYYAMSDDHRAYKRGVADYERLRNLAKEVDGGKEMMSAFSAHYSAHVTGGEVPPLPDRPEEKRPRDYDMPSSDEELHPS